MEIRNKRRIAVLTGTRAEFGILRPVIDAIIKHPKLELQLIVTGMHLSKKHGYTVKEIISYGYKVDAKVKMNLKADNGLSMAQAVGTGILGLSKSLSALKPDIFLVLGDRMEALAGTIAAAYMNIPIAHIHGGDASRAGLDESVRHAITKFSHIHFPATNKSAERIKKLGENKNNIFVIGAPGLDTILNVSLLDRTELESFLKIKLEKEFLLLVQHPVTTQINKAEDQIKETIEAVKQTNLQTIIIYPNSDAGGRRIIAVIEENLKNSKQKLFGFRSLPHKVYLSLMNYCSALIGNSSSGIIESSSFKIPVVNIGIRQEGRERSTNVIDCSSNKNDIIRALKFAKSVKFKQELSVCKNPYGDGSAGKKIANILSSIMIDENLLQKQITY